MRLSNEGTATLEGTPEALTTEGPPAPQGPVPSAPSPAPELPVLAAFERRLRAATPWTPVTITVAVLNVTVFTVMALSYHRLREFNPDVLMRWGAAYAPRTLTGEWWRTVASVFLHGGLGHLAANLCFLLLIAPLVERLLGPVRFAVVYLFAGLGGGLLALGWFPSGVMVGASGAVCGVYGALMGCYLGGLRTIPLRIFGRHAGLLVVYTGATVLLDYLDLKKSLIPHLGGLLFGFAGGLLFGHVLRPRPAWWRACHVVLATAACGVLIAATVGGVRACLRKPVQLLARYDAIRDRERALLGRFEDGVRRWEEGDMSDTELRLLLQYQLIPEWDRARRNLGLELAGEYADMEAQRLSVRDLLPKGGAHGPAREPNAKRGPTDKEYNELYRLYLKLRADNWRSIADSLRGGESHPIEPLMDELFIESLRKGLDDLANEDNPSRQWLEFSGRRPQEKKPPGGGTGGRASLLAR
jgi:rhomboid protease GluP